VVLMHVCLLPWHCAWLYLMEDFEMCVPCKAGQYSLMLLVAYVLGGLLIALYVNFCDVQTLTAFTTRIVCCSSVWKL
jgi:hypothetical protein